MDKNHFISLFAKISDLIVMFCIKNMYFCEKIYFRVYMSLKIACVCVNL